MEKQHFSVGLGTADHEITCSRFMLQGLKQVTTVVGCEVPENEGKPFHVGRADHEIDVRTDVFGIAIECAENAVRYGSVIESTHEVSEQVAARHRRECWSGGHHFATG